MNGLQWLSWMACPEGSGHERPSYHVTCAGVTSNPRWAPRYAPVMAPATGTRSSRTDPQDRTRIKPSAGGLDGPRAENRTSHEPARFVLGLLTDPASTWRGGAAAADLPGGASPRKRRFTSKYGAWQVWWNGGTSSPHRAIGPPICLSGLHG